MFSLICAWVNGWVNDREAVDLRRHRAHYDVIVMNTDHICTNLVSSDNKPFREPKLIKTRDRLLRHYDPAWLDQNQIWIFIKMSFVCFHSSFSNYGLWSDKQIVWSFNWHLLIVVRHLESNESASGAGFMVSRIQIRFQKIWPKPTLRIWDRIRFWSNQTGLYNGLICCEVANTNANTLIYIFLSLAYRGRGLMA